MTNSAATSSDRTAPRESRAVPSAEDDRARRWSLTGSEREKSRASGFRKVAPKVGLRKAHDLAVVPGIGDHQHDAICTTIARLQRDPAQ